MIVFALALAAGLAWWLWRDPRVRAAFARASWRPVVAVVVLAALTAAIAATLRGAWLPGLAAAAIALWAGLFVRRNPGAASEPAARRPEPLGPAEARALLGVPEGAGSEQIQAAYRRLMRRAHPDLGGTAGLAAQLNAARAVLLRDRP